MDDDNNNRRNRNNLGIASDLDSIVSKTTDHDLGRSRKMGGGHENRDRQTTKEIPERFLGETDKKDTQTQYLQQGGKTEID